MANVVTGNPWKLDSTGTVSTAQTYIRNILWLNGTGSLLIVDNLGRDIIRDTWASEDEHNYGPFQWVSGMTVSTIGGGEVIVVIHK